MPVLVLYVGCSESGKSKTAFVTFKDPKALEIALLLSVTFIFFYMYCIALANLGVQLIK